MAATWTASLNVASLAAALRLPTAAARVVDLSALSPAVRQAEARRLAAEPVPPPLGPDLAARLFVQSDDLANATPGLAFLVFAPPSPAAGAAEKVWASPREYWRERLPELPPPPDLPWLEAPPALPRRRLLELDAETWAPLKPRAAAAGLFPGTVVATALADALATWGQNERFTLEMEILGEAGEPSVWIPLAVDGAVPGGFAARARALQEGLRRDLRYPLRGQMPQRALPPDLPFLPVAFAAPSSFYKEGEASDDEEGERRRRGSTGRARPGVRPWLRLRAEEREGLLLLYADIAEERFPEGLADALLGACRDLLRRLAGDEPAWRDARRRLIPAQQLARIIAFNTTAAPLPEPFLHGLLAARARERADLLALAAPGRSLSYGELLRLSDNLGHRLREEGARRNTPVAVALEKGWEAVTAALGVLAAGAPWVPADPALPAERLAALLERARVELVVTRRALAAARDWPDGVRLVLLEETAEAPCEVPIPPGSQGPIPSRSPRDLACLLPGPDGGVMLENRGIANTAVDVARRYGIGRGDRVLALSPPTDGRSLLETFGALASGATLVLPPSDDPEGWLRAVERRRVTVLAAEPALAGALLASGRISPAAMPRLLLLNGGSPETMPADLVERARALRPDVRLVYLRGSLETSLASIAVEIAEPSRVLPFGEPLANTTVHVLDERLEPRPVWVPGWLYLGGPGLARGYWRDPARSASRFVTHPDTRERLYRTGDRARRLPGGDVELLPTSPPEP